MSRADLNSLKTYLEKLEQQYITPLNQKTETALQDTLTNANNYTDEKVNQAVTDIDTESIEPLQTQVDIHDRNIASLQYEVERVEGIAKGAQEGESYESYYDMVIVLNGGDKSLLKNHQSVYIGTDDVPDLWVYVIADTPKQYIYTSEEAFANDLIINKSVQVGYFIFKRLEFGKVPLENYYTKEEVDQIKQDAVNEAAIYVEEWF